MSVKLSDFATGATLSDTDHVVGYSNTNIGGERKWTVASLRNSLITGAATTIDTENLTASRALISNASGKVDVSNVTSTELNALDGISASDTIQTQLNNKQSTITGAATTVTSSNLTADRILISNASGKIAASTITITDLAAAVPTGTVMYFATSTAPSGWEECNGAVITTALGSSYTALRNLLLGASSPYGSSSGNPRLPDLRGEFIRGWDDGRGVDTGRVFGSAQTDMFKAHTHSLPVIAGSDGDEGSDSIIKARNGTGVSGSTGGTETRPRNIAMLPCIKL